MARTKMLEDREGNASSARLIGVTVIGNALIMLWTCIIFGIYHPEYFVASVAAGAGLFTGVTTATFIYLYQNKKEELLKLPDVPPTIPE